MRGINWHLGTVRKRNLASIFHSEKFGSAQVQLGSTLVQLGSAQVQMHPLDPVHPLHTMIPDFAPLILIHYFCKAVNDSYGAHLTMTSKDGVSKERIDYEKPFSNCSN